MIGVEVERALEAHPIPKHGPRLLLHGIDGRGAQLAP